MLSAHSQISAAQVGFFILAVPPLLLVLFKHGKYGLLGWIFLLTFCMLRIIGGAMVINAETTGGDPSSAQIVGQIGSSPLFFAITGIAHEASRTVVHRSKFVLGWPMQVLAHFVVSTAIALLIVGVTNAATPGNTPDETKSAISLARAGAGAFLIAFLVILLQVVIAFRQPRKIGMEKRLILAVAICMPELFLRLMYVFLGAVINSASWSVLSGGTLAEQIVLEVVPEFLIVAILVWGGIMTKSLPRDRQSGSSETGETSVEMPERRYLRAWQASFSE